ncbi:hypothetical protein RQP46_000496 [Phenoliferia psychrophenolica]
MSSLAPEERAARRISRVTPSQFDSVLASNETVSFAEGRDEALLGLASRAREASGSLDESSAPVEGAAAPAPAPAAAAPPTPVHYTSPSLHPMPSPRATSPALPKKASPQLPDVQRRSMFRSPGTASSPDLASLVRKAKEERASPEAEYVQPSPELQIRPVEPERRVEEPVVAAEAPRTRAPALTPPTSVPSEKPVVVLSTPSMQTPLVPPRRLTSPAVTPSSPPRPLALPTTTPAVVNAGLAIPGLADFAPVTTPRKQRLSESYVHVTSPVLPSSPVDSSAVKRRPSRGSKGTPVIAPLDLESPSRKVRPQSVASGNEEDPKSSFSNTMRKTSRFFRRFAGSRRRSLSLGSLGSTSPKSAARRGSKNQDDGEQFRSDLQQWKLDVDGVFGSVGDSTLRLSPNLSRAASGPTPAIGLPSFSPLALPFGHSPELERSNSTPPLGRSTSPILPPFETRRPTWDANWAKEHPVPSATLPVANVTAATTRSPLAAFDRSKMPAAHLTPSPLGSGPSIAKEPYGTPSIRLVSPATSATDLPDDPDEFALHSDRNGGANHPVENEGLGLGLETISEGKQSREGSVVSSSHTTPERHTSASSTPPDSHAAPPLLFTQGPSPVSNNGSSARLSAARKQQARQSVVAYPRTSTSPGLGSTATSKSGSVTSLSSDLVAMSAMRRGRTKSGDASSGEDGKNDVSAGASVEERAFSFAQRCWDEDPDFMEPKKIAEWLGSTGRLNVAAVRKYIDFFDFTGLRLDLAFRRLCEKLYLKAETQQVDRILEQFSRRYFENNPKCVYGEPDVVHQVAYSLLLLNTDLHVVESTSRMSRSAFVKNTFSAIHYKRDNPEADDVVAPAPALLFGARAVTDEADSTSVFGGPEEASASRKSLDRSFSKTFTRRSESGSSWKKDSPMKPTRGASPSRPKTGDSSVDNSPVKPGMTASTSSKIFDTELEATLKEMYAAIKSQPIFQPLSSTQTATEANRSSVSLTPGGSPYGTWGGDNYSTAYGAAASSHHHTPTIGFANNLSNTIIREQQEDDKSDSETSMAEQELALLGAPWAKEGLVFRKHYWETSGKRAKEKNWLQVFVVIAQGELKMFRFDTGGSSRSGSGGGGGGGGVGGGDWTSSAQSVGSLSLTHALSSSMPPPGYSRDRPHCFVLTLPGGGTYFFQAGTQDLVGEWVSTCNYWSARLSKEPLSGGVSNMEYGWNRVATNDDEDDMEEIASIRSGKSGRSGRSGASKTSFQGSMVSSHGATANDRISIADWKPPNVPTGESKLSEEAQLESLKRHVEIVRIELAVHNNLRAPMSKLFSSRSMNQAKSAANWERKSQHLLSELVKYQTYIDHLERAMKLRALRRGEKEVDNMLAAADNLGAAPDDEEPSTVVQQQGEFEAEPASFPTPTPDVPRESSDSWNGREPQSAGLSSSSMSTSQDGDQMYYEVEASTPTRSISGNN